MGENRTEETLFDEVVEGFLFRSGVRVVETRAHWNFLFHVHEVVAVYEAVLERTLHGLLLQS